MEEIQKVLSSLDLSTIEFEPTIMFCSFDGIHVQSYSLAKGDICYWIKELTKTPKPLEELTFYGLEFDQELLVSVIELLERRTIIGLCFQSCRLCFEDVLKLNTQTELLKIIDCHLDCSLSCWANFISQTKLESLVLGHVEMSQDHWKVLGKGLSRNLKSLEIYEHDFPERYHVVKSILKSSSHLLVFVFELELESGDYESQLAVVQAFQQNKTLCCFEWKDALLSEVGMEFANIFKDNFTLEFLGLKVNWSQEFLHQISKNTTCMQTNFNFVFSIPMIPMILESIPQEIQRPMVDYFQSLLAHSYWINDNRALNEVRDDTLEHFLKHARLISLLLLPMELLLGIVMSFVRVEIQFKSRNLNEKKSRSMPLLELVPYQDLLRIAKMGLDRNTIGMFNTKTKWTWNELVRQSYYSL